MNKNSGLEIENLFDPGSTCTIINYPHISRNAKVEP